MSLGNVYCKRRTKKNEFCYDLIYIIFKVEYIMLYGRGREIYIMFLSRIFRIRYNGETKDFRIVEQRFLGNNLYTKFQTIIFVNSTYRNGN